ncbi:docking protein 2-like protein [Dinothrombium tinctorium]|uniref:Docking protein 2-like protein n=1 Tax=Dinothrombium tinctorium TaxID=1965070 RepID=A0A443RP45_9ACAR|nr:docking protein 2-like protein [Dinothrombium tinctorium]
MTDWLNCLQSVAFGAFEACNQLNASCKTMDSNNLPINSPHNASNNNHIDALCNNQKSATTLVTSPVTTIAPKAQEEENLLYCSVDAPEVFRVKVCESETTKRCGLKSSNCNEETWYFLILTSVSASLAEEVSPFQKGRILYTWPYRHIRRYGCTKEGFSFEAGRKCQSGDGLFSFLTKEGNEIFQSIGSHVNNLKATQVDTQNLSDIANNFKTVNGIQKLEQDFVKDHEYFRNDTRTLSSPPMQSKTTVISIHNTKSIVKEPVKRHSIQNCQQNGHKCIKASLSRSHTDEVLRAVPAIVSQVQPILPEAKDNKNAKPLPPVTKPPRKCKNEALPPITNNEPPDPLYEDPIFVTREELLGRNTESEHIYNETENIEERKNSISSEQNQNVQEMNLQANPMSKITSAIRSIFGGGSSVNQKRILKLTDKKSSSSSTSSYSSVSSNAQNNSSPNSPSVDSPTEIKNARFAPSNATNSEQISKIVDECKVEDRKRPKSQPIVENEYANLPPLNASNENGGERFSNSGQEPYHYLQNDVEYARVVRKVGTDFVSKTDV